MRLSLVAICDTDALDRFAIGTQGVGPSWSGYAQIQLDGVGGFGGWQWALWITVSNFSRRHTAKID